MFLVVKPSFVGRPFLFTLLMLTVLVDHISHSLNFRVEQFTDITQACKSAMKPSPSSRPLRYMLNADTPAVYLSIDDDYSLKARTSKKYRRADHAQSRRSRSGKETAWITSQEFEYGDLANHNRPPPWVSNSTSAFDCLIYVETELPKGDKTGVRYDALSLMIIELNYSTHPKKPSFIEISSFGHEGHKKKTVTKNAHYSDRIWAASNPNFLLSGQLSGFDSIDYRTKVDAQHIIKPEFLHSTFDKPASITMNFTNWSGKSHVYMVFTSYKYLRQGERCQDHKEFDCSPPSFLSASNEHMCMNGRLACDGVPNCGQDYLPNQDENCLKIHWSSVLLSLVSYILLAITLLLCLSCFARVLIQWSVRSSLAELRGGLASPTGSFRSSSRFFSFLGNTFSSRWERPPPTYDEAMKHVNPDIARPQAPPTYSDTFSDHSSGGGGGGGGGQAESSGGINCLRGQGSGMSSSFGGATRVSSRHEGIVETPPPEYDCQEAQNHAYLEIGGAVAPPPPPPPPLHPSSASTAQNTTTIPAVAIYPQLSSTMPTSPLSFSQQQQQQQQQQTSTAAGAANIWPGAIENRSPPQQQQQQQQQQQKQEQTLPPLNNLSTTPMEATPMTMTTTTTSQSPPPPPPTTTTPTAKTFNPAIRTSTVVQAEICPIQE